MDDGIILLVNVLNAVPYISTKSSCEGHFDSDDYRDYRANVIFDVATGYENENQTFVKYVLSQVRDNWHDYLIHLYQEFIVPPARISLDTQWMMTIEPFYPKHPNDLTEDEKRASVDRGIQDVTEAVRKYSLIYP